MKALTLWEPWASAIACGIKTIETRSWRAPASLVGQRIAIHSARRSFGINSETAEVVRALPLDAYRTLGAYTKCDPEDGTYYPRGLVLCTATLAACIPAEHTTTNPLDALLGDYSPGRFAWVLRDVTRLSPRQPAVGRQQLWDWSGEVEA